MFRLAGQNPSVKELVYIPKPGGPKWEHPVLKPGMDGFSGPPTLETIGPYNPSEDKSGFIQLAEWKENPRGSAPPGSYRVPQWTPSGYKGDPSLTPLEYDPTGSSLDIDGPKLTEPITPPTYIPQSQEDVIASRSGLVGTQPQEEPFIFVPEEPDERFIFVPEKADPRLSEFEPFDIVRGEGGAPGDPYKGDGMPPYWPRPTPTPRPTPPAPQARMAGLSEAIAAIVKALS